MSEDSTPHQRAIEQLRKAFRPEAAAGERVTVQIVLEGAGAAALWVDVRDGRLDVGEGARAAPDLTLYVTVSDFCGVLDGTVNPDLLFMEERLRVEGELSHALRLRRLFRAPA